jgi:CRP-like cAMP-binding protein/Fe-S-cluster-containing hydrogenase component 2
LSPWEKISSLELFKTFTAEQREALEGQFEKDPTLRFKLFGAGETVCRKGEYELDLCFILRGSVDLFDDVPGKGWSKVASLGVGSFYGELGAIGGLPRTTDVVAGADGAEIFYLPRQALKFAEVNAEAREILATRYRERAVRVAAGELEIFKGVPKTFIDELIPHCEIKRYELRGVMIIKQGEPGDAFYIVRDGFVQVVREREDGTHRVLAYLRSGEYFGEMALLEREERYASVYTAGKCELIRIGRDEFVRLCERYPAAEAEVRRVIQARHQEEQRITPEISALLERSGQLGVIQSDALLVMDLDLCIKCDNCVKACESLHGKSRLIRNGIQLGKYLVPSACRHCDDPKCMNSCPTGAIKRRREGEIYFQYDLCIGCGNCAIACPYDNIAMIETKAFDKAQAHKARLMGSNKFYRPYPVAAHDAGGATLWERLFGADRATGNARRKPVAAANGEAPEPAAHVPPAFPIKCDLCDGLPFMGCVHSCPTGAAMRIDPASLFAETGAVSAGSRVRKARGGSD